MNSKQNFYRGLGWGWGGGGREGVGKNGLIDFVPLVSQMLLFLN